MAASPAKRDRTLSSASLGSGTAHSQFDGPDGATEEVTQDQGIEIMPRDLFEDDLRTLGISSWNGRGQQKEPAEVGGHRLEVRYCSIVDAGGSATGAG